MSPELGRRIAFTLGALLVFRIGTYIPLPGIDAAIWKNIFGAKAGGVLGIFDLSAGGSIRRLAIFALGILPYITAGFLVQLTMIGSSRLRALGKQGYRGRKTILAYTRTLTIALAAFQSYGIAVALESVDGAVVNPGALFALSTVLTLTAGTMFLVWLADQITAHGIGNGIALIFAVGLLTELPSAVAAAFADVNRGTLSPDMIAGAAILAAAMTALIALVEGARRQISVDYSKRKIGGSTVESLSAPLALKLNNAGLIPTLLAGWFIFLPVAAVSFVLGPRSDWGGAILHHLGHGRPAFMILYSILIVLFVLFYTAFLIDPEKASETLKTHGGAVRGVEPGEPTAAYLDYVLSRITLVGAIYLAFVFVVPELLIVYFGMPLFLGGQAMLIVVCAVMDIGAQFKQESQLQRGGYSR